MAEQPMVPVVAAPEHPRVLAPANSVRIDAAAPENCEWRQLPDKPQHRPILVCVQMDGAWIRVRPFQGFDTTTVAKAKAGDPAAMNALGRFHMYGPSSERDLDKALDLFRKAAALGDRGAMASLGDVYFEGRGVKADFSESLRWYRKAAGLGDPAALDAVAGAYLNGRGVAKDQVEGLRLLRQAADAGSGSAASSLSLAYYRGWWGLPIDPVQGLHWLKYASEHGCAVCMAVLSGLYATGDQVPQDKAESLRWLRASARAGYWESILKIEARGEEVEDP